MEGSHHHGGGGGGGGGGASSPSPFLVKTYEMVEDRATNRVVSWGPGGASFVVWNPPDFSRDMLPKYFKHNNFSSFIRQLNTYGFRKIDPERWEFANEEFRRGHTHLLKNIHRRKPVHSHSPASAAPLAEAERRELEDEIGRLKREKVVLQADLHRQAQAQSGIAWQMQSLEERLALMQRRQENVVASLCGILQRRAAVAPGSSSSSPLETDHFSKRRRVPKHDLFIEEELKVPAAAAAVPETAAIFPVSYVDSAPFDKMELALDSLEELVHTFSSYGSSHGIYGGAAAAPSPALPSEDTHGTPMAMAATGIDLQTYSPRPGCVRSPPPAAEPPSPALQFEVIHRDAAAAQADMNSEGSTTDASSHGEAPTETELSDEPATVNDLFWERFLTETPRSLHGRRERAEANDGARTGSWMHHRDNVVQITEQMGLLAPAEKSLMS